MDSDFWVKIWQTGETRFHQEKFHPELERFGVKFAPGTVLVPLCGKTLDMIYLASKGHSVIGVELSPIACRDFFIENKISYTETSHENFVVFSSTHITLWCGDFFKLPDSVWNGISGIYDRAALVALPPEMRQKYAAEMKKRTHQRVGVLLISFEYPEGAMQGPPFSVTEDEIRKLYVGCEIEKIHSEVEERSFKDHPRLGSIQVTQTVFWLVTSGS